MEACEIWIASLTGGSEKISSNLTATLREYIHTKSIRSYWEKKGKFPRGGQRLVDWSLKRQSHKTFPKGQNRWLSKHNTGFCGVGKKLKEYQFQKHTDCPRCGRANETPAHVLQCRNADACALWDKELSNLLTWMKSHDIHPDLAQSIHDHLHAWKYGIPHPIEIPSFGTRNCQPYSHG